MIKTLFMLCFRACLTVCYLPFRLMKPKHKIVFLSRQSNQPGMDFVMLDEEIRRTDPRVQTVMLCRTIGSGIKGKIGYGFHLFSQMYHLATAKAAVLDGYCITACLLRHRKSLKIFQIWHALGLLKNFGYAAVGSSEGSSARTARIMRMHRGYYKIVCSSPTIMEDIARCYDAPIDRMLPVGLPRVDFLTDPALQADTKEKILAAYPGLADGKPVIVYVPTFRKEGEIPVKELTEAIDPRRYHLVVKLHDGSEQVVTAHGTLRNPTGLTGLEWLTVADFAVTDYSAVLFEAMTAGKPVVLFCYDRADYVGARGFATPYDRIPAPRCATPQAVAEAIERQDFDRAAIDAFLSHHVAVRNTNCTKALSREILAAMKEKIENKDSI